ncbi:MAG: NAD(P)/FAD-dependent oxidoreductase [Anaerolineaceae bacterium]|nr:NAD(P)/FAD-dependent oxidoreductase [Anaerolineaceae bacterium]
MIQAAYDVIVVGAGPAGAIAARKAAESGMDTLLIEKRLEIGTPVRCGESFELHTASQYLEDIPNQPWVNTITRYFSIHNTKGDCVVVPPISPSIICDRKIFDREVAYTAANAGVQVLVNARAESLLQDQDGAVVGLKINCMGSPLDVYSKVVIAADGTESQLARWAGLKSIPALSDLYVGTQFLVSGLSGQIRTDTSHYYVGEAIAPGGYVWVFPKSADTANIGIVISGDRAEGTSAQGHLEGFLQEVFPRARSVLGQVTGGIPVTGGLKRLVTDGLMVVGDAAHQADPLTAGGIVLGMVAGDYAGTAAAQCIREGDVRAQSLSRYEKRWRERFGKQQRSLRTVRRMLTKMDSDLLDGLIRTAAGYDMTRISPAKAMIHMLTKHPRLLIEARVLINSGLIMK